MKTPASATAPSALHEVKHETTETAPAAIVPTGPEFLLVDRDGQRYPAVVERKRTIEITREESKEVEKREVFDVRVFTPETWALPAELRRGVPVCGVQLRAEGVKTRGKKYLLPA